MARREEWQEQKKLARLLDKWLDPACTFWTATDPVAPSALSGAIRKQRGVKPGVPDTFVLYRRKLVTLELKSRVGKCTPSQRAVRAALLRAGCDWWVCRSADAAMWALRKSGVKFRALVREDGMKERWRQPKLAPWEVPRRDPAEPRPNAPEVIAQRRAARQRWRERQRVGDVTQRAAAAITKGHKSGAGDNELRPVRTTVTGAARTAGGDCG